jgi:hypothetical protein
LDKGLEFKKNFSDKVKNALIKGKELDDMKKISDYFNENKSEKL